MKYEIIKGSEKDFEGAPGDALVKFKNAGTDYFCDKFEVGGRWTNPLYGKNIYLNEGLSGLLVGATVIAERRPITEPVWDGEGLPPVGAECEIKRVAEWLPVKIEFISDTNTIFTTRGGTEECYHTHSLKFRPIRSPEDVARDEAIANICFAIGVRPDNIVVQQTYDAIAAGKIPGITKTPTVSELMRVTENATREDCEAIVKLLGGEK